MIALVRGLEPKDSLEATLATQMAAVHGLTMRLANQLANSTTNKGKEPPNARADHRAAFSTGYDVRSAAIRFTRSSACDWRTRSEVAPRDGDIAAWCEICIRQNWRPRPASCQSKISSPRDVRRIFALKSNP